MTDAKYTITQLTLDGKPLPDGEPEARARHTDPATSHAAARSVEEIRASQASVLRVFRTIGALHDQGLVAIYQRSGLEPRQSESGIRTRRKELVVKGKLRDSGERKRLPSGRLSIIWELRPEDWPNPQKDDDGMGGVPLRLVREP